ncbi:copper chaperone PCu(A)C [Histidinibacterium lentulum]|uniref:Copper chaperone PCu(A)C n=1 Tax=Histidinibacterium lentulum TaxID=2480588 RepID=A0A3N2R1D0_9RHOB|nr:copper chaperone PCu(A)C [Histidinibacterium lentulum]ROU01096.1 copper chaperone PCu(A)C [Histidinibacterium lentulum]
MRPTFPAAALAALIALPAAAEPVIEIRDAYARASNTMAGAAFMVIENTGTSPDRLVAAASDSAARVELHTHVMDGDVMRMIHVEEGFEIPAGDSVLLERGGKHVMFMGLSAPFEDGAGLEVTLTFETAGEIVVEVPVDQERMPAEMGHDTMDHGTMDHGHADHGGS